MKNAKIQKFKCDILSNFQTIYRKFFSLYFLLLSLQFFVRAMFDYEPAKDNLLPCQDIGLIFKKGDVLEIVNWSDPSWWQARKVNSQERPGLVPSQDLEERRKCFVKHNGFNKQISCCGTTVRPLLLHKVLKNIPKSHFYNIASEAS